MAFLSEEDIEKILLKQFCDLGYTNLPGSVIGHNGSEAEAIVEELI